MGDRRALDGQGRRGISYFFVIIYAIVSYFILYVFKAFLGPIVAQDRLESQPIFFIAVLNDTVPIDIREVFFASLIGVGVGLLASILINTNAFYEAMQKLGFTQKKGYSTIWDFAFSDAFVPRWAIVRDHKRGVAYFGLVEAKSDYKSEHGEILLSNVQVSDTATGEVFYQTDYLYLARSKGEWTVEFVDVDLDATNLPLEETDQ